MGEVVVGVGTYHVASNPTKLICIGLGSCLGIAIWDRRSHLGGLAHAMLPYYKDGRDKSNGAKYVDTTIYLMVDDMLDLGAKRHNLKAKLVGGAQMFSFLPSDTLNIGQRNIEAARKILNAERIPIVAEEVGGKSGRTITFDTVNGLIAVKSNGRNRTEF